MATADTQGNVFNEPKNRAEGLERVRALAYEPEIRVLDPVHVASCAPVSATLHPLPQFFACMDNRNKNRP